MHRALLLLKKVPKGKVVSYGELARNCKTSPRAIGIVMKSNPFPEKYPCYKVVGSDGRLVGYSGKGGLKTKIMLLKSEGVKIDGGKISGNYFYKLS
ncbi:MAG: MGMT family protein [Candidatus Aenigmarchaeota archaeon]|nr:MGMT family protein [Candidatus Aenigmarchaeota archaeon]